MSPRQTRAQLDDVQCLFRRRLPLLERLIGQSEVENGIDESRAQGRCMLKAADCRGSIALLPFQDDAEGRSRRQQGIARRCQFACRRNSRTRRSYLLLYADLMPAGDEPMPGATPLRQ